MTIFGIDISSYQNGINLTSVRNQGYSFVIAKCTEGRGHKNSTYPAYRKAAQEAGLLFAAYHFLRSDSPAADQARNIAEWIGDKRIPIMIDCEVSGDSRPNLAHCSAFAAACGRLGMRVSLLYLPRFWWQQIGSPTLNGWNVVQALYGSNPQGHGSTIYPGDSSARWAVMGGVSPTILQYGSRCKIDGYSGDVDVNAFRGTLSDLKRLGIFMDWSQTPIKPIVTPPVQPRPKPPIVIAPPKVYVTVRRWPHKNSTLSGIAKGAGISLTALLKLNPAIRNADKIFPGQKVRIR